jgi:hypothetical protein
MGIFMTISVTGYVDIYQNSNLENRIGTGGGNGYIFAS